MKRREKEEVIDLRTPFVEGEWMESYNWEEKSIIKKLETMLDSPEYLKQVISDRDDKIDRLEEELYRLKAHWTIRLKWKIVEIFNKIPRYTIKIERK